MNDVTHASAWGGRPEPIFPSDEYVLARQLAVADGMVKASEVIRRRSAPPDGRTRTEVPMTPREVADLLGVSPSTVKRAEETVGAVSRNDTGNREFFSADVARILPVIHGDETRIAMGRRPQCVVVANQKGGVGKTTTAVNLALDLATRGYRVLMIDLDPQASMTASMLVDRGDGTMVEGANLAATAEQTAADVLSGNERSLMPLIRRTHWPTVDIVPASPNLASVEFDLIAEFAQSKVERRHPRFWESFREAVAALPSDRYDVVVVDTPPTLSLAMIIAMVAADGILIPCPMRNLDIESLRIFVTVTQEWLKKVSEQYPPQVRWINMMPTMRTTSFTEDLNESTVRMYVGELDFVLPAGMPRLEALQRASGGASTVFEEQATSITTAKRSAAAARRTVRQVHEPVLAVMRAAARTVRAGT